MSPSSNLLFVLVAWSGAGAAASLWPPLAPLWQWSGLAVAAAVIVDALLLEPASRFNCSRTAARTLALGAWRPLSLTVTSRAGRTIEADVFDQAPAEFASEGLPAALVVPAGGSSEMTYRLKPQRRGDAHFSEVELRIRSRFGLWRKRCRVAAPGLVKVYPNFAEISRYTILATDNRLSDLGVRRRQRRGEGNDFHQLREYRVGDSLRQIDWKASSRVHRLVSREYQDERDQQIVFLLDCGRRMRHEDADRVHLDQALNATMLLAWVAASQGDAVGLLSFAGQRRWFPPAKGRASVNRLLDHVYDLEATEREADYLRTVSQLMTLQRRRCLIVVVTNTRGESTSGLVEAFKLAGRRHLVVLADVREAFVRATLTRPVDTLDRAFAYHGVQQYLADRRSLHEMLRHIGVFTLDVTPAMLPIALVNQYYALKRAAAI